MTGTCACSGQGLGFRFQYGEWCDMLVNSGGWLGIPHVRYAALSGMVLIFNLLKHAYQRESFM